MDLVGYCMRCSRWFDGEQCPGCDGDRRSRYVSNPFAEGVACDVPGCPGECKLMVAVAGFGVWDCPVCGGRQLRAQ